MKQILYVSIIVFFVTNCNNKVKEDAFTHGDVNFERPVLITKSENIYPDSLKRDSIKGKVLVHCIVDTLGHVRSAIIFKTTDRRLNSAALETVKHYVFSPGKQNDKLIECKMAVSIKFE
ncbi:TonB family protein [candidate division KSB1 bacterium]|nr:TonB family protein [candidate division KSB1 bacterium]